MTKNSRELSIGQIAARTGVAVSAIRFYADEGLIEANRNSGGHRRFARAQIRRVSFVLIAQQLGLTLPQIKDILGQLPEGRTPTKQDWKVISEAFQDRIDDQIARLTQMRETLDGCIGCGCLSLDACALYNPEDRMSQRGSGPVIALP